MKFIVSSHDLLNHLQSISRVISSKNSLPILDDFLFHLKDNLLTITASDLETTLITKMKIENAGEGGSIALPAHLLTDTLKEFPDEPLTFEINLETLGVEILAEQGKYNIVGQRAIEYPQIPEIREEVKTSMEIDPVVLCNGITRTLFATANDDLRPIMNGIFFDMTTEQITMVASDAHKLVRYIRKGTGANKDGSFILPKKPASLLKNMLPKEEENVVVEFDDKNASFTMNDHRLICRLVEGSYPSYNSVIPQNNPNKLCVDREALLNSLKRVSVFSNQASNLVRLEIAGNQLTLSAQDLDFSVSASEWLNCQYEGDDMEIGFKSTFLVEILVNLPGEEVVFELADPTRAGIILPAEQESKDDDLLMLLMPMMIGGTS
ncbi:MAG TPA: DNA polymerase III subunit beta [Bacteroidetes bacterium]|nr:DNA polymerase III subunit beta [Bacteroidota bacterium]